jgi:hypothetical protein
LNSLDSSFNADRGDYVQGEIKPGFAADFALVDIGEEQLKFSTPESLMGSFVFGANGTSVVKATAVNGKWKKTTASKSVESAAAEAPVSAEHKKQIEVAAKLADANSDDVVNLTYALMNVQSTSGDEVAAGQLLAKWLEARGWKVELQKVAPQSDSSVRADR